ncbi:MAG: CinA family protein [Loktanella sp.]|nr:CinA family protein [Loktanella sp.]
MASHDNATEYRRHAPSEELAADLPAHVVQTLRAQRKTLATAESCTGGLLASYLTAVPGCSQVFGTGVVSYSWDCKRRLLGVRRRTLVMHGAVSRETAGEMARGVRRRAGAHLGVALTGEAGPQAAEAKPVGRVYIALADAKQTWVQACQLDTPDRDREGIRRAAAFCALDMVCRYLEGRPLDENKQTERENDADTGN